MVPEGDGRVSGRGLTGWACYGRGGGGEGALCPRRSVPAETPLEAAEVTPRETCV